MLSAEEVSTVDGETGRTELENTVHALLNGGYREGVRLTADNVMIGKLTELKHPDASWWHGVQGSVDDAPTQTHDVWWKLPAWPSPSRLPTRGRKGYTLPWRPTEGRRYPDEVSSS